MLSAFRVGRQLTRWRFFAIQQWFGASEAVRHCTATATELEQEVRGLISPADRDELQRAIRSWRRKWQETLRTDALAEQRHQAAQELAACERDEDYFVRLRQEVDLLLGPVNEHADQFHKIIQRHLDQSGIAATSLGEWLELGLCNEDVAYDLPGRGDDSHIVDERSPNWPWDAPSRTDPEFYLARRFFAPGELQPPEGWQQGLQQRWRELGALTANRALSIEQPVDGSRDLSVEELMDAVGAAFESALHEAEIGTTVNDTQHNTQPGYLGLILDKQRFLVRRRGLAKEVDLSSQPLSWEILKLLFDAKRGFSNSVDLEAAWVSAGRTSNPNQRTMENRLTELRGFLRDLNVTISGSQKNGWRLQSAEPVES
jgi:hypothetical protein